MRFILKVGTHRLIHLLYAVQRKLMGFAGKWLERSATGIRSQLLDKTMETFLEYPEAKANESLPMCASQCITSIFQIMQRTDPIAYKQESSMVLCGYSLLWSGHSQ